MQLKKRMKLFIAGVAGLVFMSAAGVASAQPSAAAPCINEMNATATHGSHYKARFLHSGERLKVWDEDTDGLAAVAYVRVHRFQGCDGQVPLWGGVIDSDRFVMDHGYHNYNLGTPDGTGDIAEDYLVEIRVCKGYASNPGNNCSGWENGVA